MPEKEAKKSRTRFQKTVQWVTILILFSFVTGSIIVGGLSFRSSQNVKTPSPVNSEAKGADEIKRWKEAAKLNTNDPFTLRNLARAQMQAEKLSDAQKTLLSAEKKSPNDPLTLELLGQLYLALGKGKEAVGQFMKALKAKPDDIMLNYETALSYSLFGDEERALPYYEKAAQRGGNSREGLSARFAILQIYLRQGDFKKAETIGLSLEKAIPGNPKILQSLVDVFNHEKKWAEALTCQEKLKNAEPSTENTVRLADLYMKNRNPAEAGKIWLDLISKNPNNPSYKYELALVDKKTGKSAEAKDLLNRALKEAAGEHDEALKEKIEAKLRGL